MKINILATPMFLLEPKAVHLQTERIQLYGVQHKCMFPTKFTFRRQGGPTVGRETGKGRQSSRLKVTQQLYVKPLA